MTTEDFKSEIIIIAEAGVNHNGDIDLAKRLIDAAADAGADFVKFQTFKAKNLVSKSAMKADYQNKNTGEADQSQFKMLKKLELDEGAHIELKGYCKKKGISFLSSAFDEASVDFLEQLGMEVFKIPSGEITNKPYLQHIAKKGKSVILSTGMANLEEVKAAIAVLLEEKLDKQKITVLHCNTEYPTPMEDVNLKAMLTIRDELDVEVGYSDHTLGIEVPIAAVALGAMVIEKHFTLDRTLPGPDHKASLEPAELKSMVTAIRNIELAMSGNGIKAASDSERPNIAVARKSIHLKARTTSGTILTSDHLVMKRPGSGISPMEIDNVIGRTLSVTLEADTLLSWDHLKK
ncbi:MAG TPA: N-acetylneuraminate synthase [Desulfobacteraceae bacterium]|nr:N-acetylneuraminate synthase [Desulfobacteraceae bacterium]HPQ27849.1 N-acetylneuraminate synthase [Desulfobacteraceae bacterium]